MIPVSLSDDEDTCACHAPHAEQAERAPHADDVEYASDTEITERASDGEQGKCTDGTEMRTHIREDGHAGHPSAIQ